MMQTKQRHTEYKNVLPLAGQIGVVDRSSRVLLAAHRFGWNPRFPSAVVVSAVVISAVVGSVIEMIQGQNDDQRLSR